MYVTLAMYVFMYLCMHIHMYACMCMQNVCISMHVHLIYILDPEYIAKYNNLFIFLQTIDCDTSYNLNLTYHSSQNVTLALLKSFYNGYTLHRRFIKERLLVLKINRSQRRQLGMIKKELEHNIARIYYLVSVV